jgi:hypothetical protein
LLPATDFLQITSKSPGMVRGFFIDEKSRPVRANRVKVFRLLKATNNAGCWFVWPIGAGIYSPVSLATDDKLGSSVARLNEH